MVTTVTVSRKPGTGVLYLRSSSGNSYDGGTNINAGEIDCGIIMITLVPVQSLLTTVQDSMFITVPSATASSSMEPILHHTVTYLAATPEPLPETSS
jgi:autotransporter-associated beta strand protein